MVVPSKQLMVWRGNQFGPGVYKVENLNVLGYNTNVIDWVEYYRALKGKSNLRYLSDLLDIGEGYILHCFRAYICQ